jgi:hypothetical protein
MPQLDLTPVTPYSPLWPYHVEFDNLPILQLVNQILLVNNAVENAEDVLRSAIGTQGTLANRLAQSIEADGGLRTDAVDATFHNIACHTDGSISGISFVRMRHDERTKLSLIADEATALTLTFTGISTTPTFDDQDVEFTNSDSVVWRLEAGNRIYADLTFPVEAAHQHYYDRTPAHVTPSTPDYRHYKSTSIATPFIDESLRVYVNGVRLSATASHYVPGATPTAAWTLLTYSANAAGGTFTLSTPITSADLIRIDFDTTY